MKQKLIWLAVSVFVGGLLLIPAQKHLSWLVYAMPKEHEELKEDRDFLMEQQKVLTEQSVQTGRWIDAFESHKDQVEWKRQNAPEGFYYDSDLDGYIPKAGD